MIYIFIILEDPTTQMYCQNMYSLFTHNTQICEVQQKPMSSTQVLSTSASVESQSSPLLTDSNSIQTPMPSNGVAVSSSNHQDRSAPGGTPLTTAAKRCSPSSSQHPLYG